jgi:hypothetical protein
MKSKHIAASILMMAVGLVAMTSTIFRASQPSNETKEKIYVLPLVEDMPTVANPLQF